MSRFGLVVLVLGICAAAGCRMCAHPYDYTGPVMDGQCSSCTVPGGRAGSILDPGLPMVADAQVQPAAAVDPVAAAQPVGSGARVLPAGSVPGPQRGAVSAAPVAAAPAALAPEVPQGAWALRGASMY